MTLPDVVVGQQHTAAHNAERQKINDFLTRPYVQLVKTPDTLITGVITRDGNGTATSAPVTWPDGTPGIYTADVVSAAFPGAVDAYHVTYGNPVTKTYTQPAVTRDSTGAVTNVPAIVVS